MRPMRSWAIALACALSACTFDGSGTESGSDDGVEPAPDAASIAVDAPPPIDAAPPPPIDAAPTPIDAAPGFVCDFDSTCDAGEDQLCPDCLGGGFVCDFDTMCELGEDPDCLDCLFGP